VNHITRTTQPLPPSLGATISLVSVAEYAKMRANVFGSTESLRWFLRMHRTRLVEAGAVFLLTNRWMVNPTAFDAAVLEIGSRAAERATA